MSESILTVSCSQTNCGCSIWILHIASEPGCWDDITFVLSIIVLGKRDVGAENKIKLSDKQKKKKETPGRSAMNI